MSRTAARSRRYDLLFLLSSVLVFAYGLGFYLLGNSGIQLALHNTYLVIAVFQLYLIMALYLDLMGVLYFFLRRFMKFHAILAWGHLLLSLQFMFGIYWLLSYNRLLLLSGGGFVVGQFLFLLNMALFVINKWQRKN